MDRMQFDFPGFIFIFSIAVLITLLDLVNKTQWVSQISAADAKLKNWSWQFVQHCRWCAAWEVEEDFIDPIMSFPTLLSSHWTGHSISTAITYVWQCHTSLSGVTPAPQRKMLMTSLHFTEPHLFLGICILILLWLVEVLGVFCGHLFALTQSIEVIFAGTVERMMPV